MNRLASETSPYLLQHADNPVDWYPWGDEAFALARAEDRPILLSVGYAACHWCHVMEHESFEDDETAALMNRDFVPVKVDREERPDVDGLYMDAVVAMTGHGGWPMTVFLTPDGRPFYGGTYFPPEPQARHAELLAGAPGRLGGLQEPPPRPRAAGRRARRRHQAGERPGALGRAADERPPERGRAGASPLLRPATRAASARRRSSRPPRRSSSSSASTPPTATRRRSRWRA